MRLATRLRIGIKWVCTACVVLLAMAWFVSGCCYLTWSNGLDKSFEVHRGRVAVWDGSMVKGNNPAHLHARRMRGRPIWDWYYNGAASPWDWAFHTGRFSSGDGGTTVIPLWMPLLVMAVPTAVLWIPDVRAVWRRRKGRCVWCGHDRSGLAAETLCPECGKTNSHRLASVSVQK